MTQTTTNPVTSARALYNATLDAFGRRLSTIDGWTPDATLAPSECGWVVYSDGPDAETAAERVFADLNRDDRPNGRTEYSLFVGDVVEVVRANGSREWLAVVGCGFDRIPVDSCPVLDRWFAHVLADRRSEAR